MNIFNLLFSLSYQIIPRISRNLFLIMHSSGKTQKLFIPPFFVPDSGVYWM